MDRHLPNGTVTLVFTDIEGSTRLLQTLGDRYGSALTEHHRILRETWVAHGGVEVDTEGDAFFVAFTRAPDAVAAAADAQRSLAAHPWPDDARVRVRIGIHTGSPQQQDTGYWGEDVHYAARLAAAAHGGQVLVSASTRELVAVGVQSLGEHAVKDFPVPREIFHVVLDGVPASAFPPPRTLRAPRSNVPARTNVLLGRDAEVADLLVRLETQPLITVAGPGGVGKTRLLVQIGHELAATGRFDQLAFVAAEQLVSVDALLDAVVRALGMVDRNDIDAADRLSAHLSGRRVLLLVDNLEQVTDAGPALARLATAGPDVRVVCTSQVPLHVAAERVVRLAPLALPADTGTGAVAVADNPAVALLLQRAAAIGSAFVLDDANAADVVRLCTQLDGMPLALELAAARLDLLSPAQLADRLESGLDALGRGNRELPARQRGLRAVLEWTCGLLTDDQRDLLARLSVCADGLPPDLIEAAFGDCLDELAALLDASLLYRTADGRLMCRPPVRRFGQEVLVSTGRLDAAFAGLADALTQLAAPLADFCIVRDDVGLMRRRLNAEAGSLLATLDWAAVNDPERHDRLAVATAWWLPPKLTDVGVRHVRSALARARDARARADCLHALGWFGQDDGDPGPALEAASAWHDLDDPDHEAMALAQAANVHAIAGRYRDSSVVVERALGLLRSHARPDPDVVWFVDAMRAQALNGVGDPAAARAVLEPWVAAQRGSRYHYGVTATILADIALADDRPADALPLYGSALLMFLRQGPHMVGAVMQADGISAALAHTGRFDEAAVCLAVCTLVHAELGWSPPSTNQNQLDVARTALRGAQLAAGAAHARALGVEAGLVWVAEVAAG